MNDMTPPNREAGRELDRLLHEAYSDPGKLPEDFENRVMSRLQGSLSAPPSRAVSLVMGLYWSVAVLLCSWLILGNGSPGEEAASVLPVLMFAVALSFTAVWLLLRGSQLRLSDLFLRTLQ